MGVVSAKKETGKPAVKGTVAFADLDIGSRFDFDREHVSTRIIVGPFVKVSARKYRLYGQPEAKEMLLSRPSTAVVKLED